MKAIRKILGLPVWLLGFAFLLAAVVGNIGAPLFSKSIELFLGLDTYEVKGETGEVYYPSSYQTAEEQYSAATALAREIEREGIVMLRNEHDALPLSSGARVTLLGQDSVDFVYGGAGSGSIDASSAATLREALEQAGLVVNPVAWDFYAEGAGSKYRKVVPDITGSGGFAVNEVPLLEFTDELRSSYADYGDAAVVTFGRTGSESVDLPADYLAFTAEELDTAREACDNFETVVVLLNTSNAMQLEPLIDMGVDAILVVSSPGQAGIEAIGDVLSGRVNPSGHLVDTYVSDIASAPAMANFGDYTIVNSTVDSGTKYLVYSEGIYVGYRYYETRYEDKVLGQGNAGDFDYDAEVTYPFGHGLSYTDFSWSGYTVAEKDNTVEVTITVTNEGDVAGKDVVELYLQKPYTDYDRANGVEKSAIELVAFAKTELLGPGESKALTISFDRELFRSYDADGAGTYIVEPGTYYVVAGRDAHAALSSVLAARGADVAGDTSLVGTIEVKGDVDATTFSAGADGEAITNQFADVDVRTYRDDFVYLSRSDWQGTWPTTFAEGNWTASDELLSALEISYDEDDSATMPDFEADNGLTLAALVGAAYDDPRWDQLMDQMSKQEIWNLVRQSGYRSDMITSIAMPAVVLKDGPAGISATLMGGDISCMSYPVEVVLASTWNTELAYEMGKMVGEDSISASTTVWYAPAMNIHRAATSGRNFEYYAEDGVLSAQMAAAECRGCAEKGTIVTIKHFALNDQETNRGGGAYFANEQAIREVYLRGFEGAVREGDAGGVMTSMNRIGARWSGGHAGLMTATLRNEWGFKGFATTDQTTFPNFAYADIREGLEAGNDMWLNAGDLMFNENVNEIDATTWSRVRVAAHRILFQYANSNAMNGISADAKITAAFPLWQALRVAVTVISVALMCGCFKLAHLIAGTRTLWQVIRRKPKVDDAA